MRKVFFLTVIISVLFSCNNRENIVDKSELLGDDYRLFQNTPAWELAKAVEDENEDKKNRSGNKNGGAKSIQKSDEDDSEEESEENDEDEEDDDDDDDDDGNNYLKKFDKELRKNYLLDFHPESIINNYSEIQFLIKVIKNDKDVIIDELHKTIPFLTKYEKTRVLGQRAKQINSGSAPFVEVDDNIMDGLLIAQKELHQKKIPFIIQRPLPNGGSEYWRLNDLEMIS